ncbi:ArpU family phage packaging/lysis transcriptional regulator [Isobaculum melis]|uniref:Phage transcriptional regulator, ArpU family n=1 Tax=Isobaculum melis TaxID=142588 RepID=A0A1H9TGV0_9LACT|nr:ArpU family phage packaging/lysis transcriptional regulator [Isobaculum melis]SER96348.1 phage transcriptional regulator, ArpU family [Isobaculum melis]
MRENRVERSSRKKVDEKLKAVPKLVAVASLYGRKIARQELVERSKEALEELEDIKSTIALLPQKEQQDIIEKRYLKHNEYDTDIQVYMELNMSESYYYRMKREALETLAFFWGF